MFSTSGKQNGAPKTSDRNVRVLRSIFCLAVLPGLLLLGLTACGKKSWPEPNASQERFDFKDESAQIAHNCLEIKTKISGNKDNISKIILELTETDTATDCPTCPFHPELRVEFPLSDPQLKIGRKSISLRYCNIESGVSYRWRLVGYSSYPGLGAVASRVIMTRPAPEEAEIRTRESIEIIEQDNATGAEIEMEYKDSEIIVPEQ